MQANKKTAMDIGQLIKFKKPGEDDGRPPKRSINTLLNIPVKIIAWDVKQSRFEDGNKMGRYVEIEGEEIKSGSKWRVNTGSLVIIDQLHNVERALLDQHANTREFTCVFKRTPTCLKMFPVED